MLDALTMIAYDASSLIKLDIYQAWYFIILDQGWHFVLDQGSHFINLDIVLHQVWSTLIWSTNKTDWCQPQSSMILIMIKRASSTTIKLYIKHDQLEHFYACKGVSWSPSEGKSYKSENPFDIYWNYYRFREYDMW